MKKLENLTKKMETMAASDFAKIIDNPEIDEEYLTDKEKFALLVYEELDKELTNKSRKLVLDCNYANSKKHNRTAKEIENGIEEEYLVDYFRLVPATDVNTTLIQIKCTGIDLTNHNIAFKLHCTCKSGVQEQLIPLGFKTSFNKKTGRAKTSTRLGVTYDELPDLVKSICALLSAKPKKSEEVEIKPEQVKIKPEELKVKSDEVKTPKKPRVRRNKTTEVKSDSIS